MVVSLHIATGDKENQPINVDGEIQPGGQQQKDGKQVKNHMAQNRIAIQQKQQ